MTYLPHAPSQSTPRGFRRVFIPLPLSQTPTACSYVWGWPSRWLFYRGHSVHSAKLRLILFEANAHYDTPVLPICFVNL